MLGASSYSCSLDMWACGCIFAELLLGDGSPPLFYGKTELDVQNNMFKVLGTPTQSEWPGLISLPKFSTVFPMYEPKSLMSIFGERANNDAISLLKVGRLNNHQEMLIFNPQERIMACEALDHPYFD